MHKSVLQIIFIWYFIFSSAKSSHSFFAEKSYKRSKASYQHVKSQIKLQFINQQWILNILLYYILLFLHIGLLRNFFVFLNN